MCADTELSPTRAADAVATAHTTSSLSSGRPILRSAARETAAINTTSAQSHTRKATDGLCHLQEASTGPKIRIQTAEYD